LRKHNYIVLILTHNRFTSWRNIEGEGEQMSSGLVWSGWWSGVVVSALASINEVGKAKAGMVHSVSG